MFKDKGLGEFNEGEYNGKGFAEEGGGMGRFGLGGKGFLGGIFGEVSFKESMIRNRS